MDINKLLGGMEKLNASDLHMKVGSPPMYRIDGELRPLDLPSMKPKDTEEAYLEMTPGKRRETFDEIGTVDFSYSLPGIARFRVNAFHQRGSISISVRRVTSNIPTIQELELPATLEKIAQKKRGLILLTGATGSGKSTTLASMIDYINRSRREHIITIEDPIEYLYKDQKSIINQVEMGVDTIDFETAIKHVLRQDPDVILIGELRDKETMKIAMAAAETGHLVFSTLHTPDARQSINRILHFYTANDEPMILQQLSLNLQAVISQRLMRRAGGKGRIAACEILVNTPIVSKLVREGRISDITQAIQNAEEGMQTFNQALVSLTREGKVDFEEAIRYVEDPAAFKRNVKGIYSEGDRRGLVGF